MVPPKTPSRTLCPWYLSVIEDVQEPINVPKGGITVCTWNLVKWKLGKHVVKLLTGIKWKVDISPIPFTLV